MFRDYKHRGEAFAAAVEGVEELMASLVFGQGNTRTAGAPAPEYDRSLAWAALLLVALGLVMVYSASIATAEASRYTGQQSGLLPAAPRPVPRACARAPRPRCSWCRCASGRKAAPWLFAACFVLLVLVLIPGIGREVNGARRWLNLGVATMQPSELMKLAVVLYAADYTVRKHAVLKNFKRGLLPMLARDAGGGLAAAARARFRRLRGDRGDAPSACCSSAA